MDDGTTGSATASCVNDVTHYKPTTGQWLPPPPSSSSPPLLAPDTVDTANGARGSQPHAVHTSQPRRHPHRDQQQQLPDTGRERQPGEREIPETASCCGGRGADVLKKVRGGGTKCVRPLASCSSSSFSSSVSRSQSSSGAAAASAGGGEQGEEQALRARFVTTANQLTQLYLQGVHSQKRAREAGFSACLALVREFVEQNSGTNGFTDSISAQSLLQFLQTLSPNQDHTGDTSQSTPAQTPETNEGPIFSFEPTSPRKRPFDYSDYYDNLTYFKQMRISDNVTPSTSTAPIILQPSILSTTSPLPPQNAPHTTTTTGHTFATLPPPSCKNKD